MPTYRVTDPDTGRTVKLTGDSPPTEAELEQIFSQLQQPAAATGQIDVPQEAQVDRSLGQKILQGVQQGITRPFDIASAALPVAAGVVSEPIAGLVGLGAEAIGADGAQAVQSVQDTLSVAPPTEGGKRFLGQVGELAQNIPDIGDAVFRATGSPEAALAADVVPTAIAELTGAKFLRKARSAAPGNIAQIQDQLAQEQTVRQARAISEKTGIGLFKAQQTLNPSDLEVQSFLAQTPEAARAARDALSKQNVQVADAVDSFIGSLAPPESVSSAAGRFRDASQRAVEAQKLIRRERTSPLYKQAFETGANVDVQPVFDLIRNKLTDLPEGGEISKTLLRTAKLITKSDGQPSLKQLHNAKLEIDQMLNKFGTDSLGNTTKAELAEVKDALLGQITDASPQYQQALEAFREASPAVNQLNDSIIGAISGYDDIQLKNVAQRVFDPSENVATIKQAKKAIESVDPDAWNALFRAEMERRLGQVRIDLQDLSGATAAQNVPGQLYTSLFGNKKKRDVLLASIDGEAKKNLTYLMHGLKKAATGRTVGSQTAARQDIQRRLGRGVSQTIRDFIGRPLQAASDVGGEAAFNARVKALSDVMFDPQYKQQMSKIRKLPTESEQAAREFNKLLGTALVAAPTIEAQDGTSN